MSRLTGKEEKGRYYIVEEKICIATVQINPIRTWITGNENRGYGKPIDKLGKLEDLEEELGCPLEVVFKALKNGFYIENHFELGNVFLNNSNENIGLEYYENHNYCCYGITWGGTDICFTKDYKKTWWLRKDKKE